MNLKTKLLLDFIDFIAELLIAISILTIVLSPIIYVYLFTPY